MFYFANVTSYDYRVTQHVPLILYVRPLTGGLHSKFYRIYIKYLNYIVNLLHTLPFG